MRVALNHFRITLRITWGLLGVFFVYEGIALGLLWDNRWHVIVTLNRDDLGCTLGSLRAHFWQVSVALSRLRVTSGSLCHNFGIALGSLWDLWWHMRVARNHFRVSLDHFGYTLGSLSADEGGSESL